MIEQLFYQIVHSHSILDAIVSMLSSMHLYILIILIIAFCFNRQAGLQLFSLVTFSLYLSTVLHHFHFLEQDRSETATHLIPNINTHLLVLSVFFCYLIPAISKRLFTIVSLLFLILMSFIHVLYYEFAIWDISITISIGIFIVFTFYRSLDWLGAIPEQLKLMLIFIIPFCLFLLSFENGYLVGLLFALMLGIHVEKLKLSSQILQGFYKKLFAFFIGLSGMYIIDFIFHSIPQTTLTQIAQGVASGIWLTYFAPLLLVKLHVYERFQLKIRKLG